MNKKDLIFTALLISFVIYKIKTFKIGPCSPEMELLINGK